MARKYRDFVYDENQRFIYPTSDWGFKYLLGTEENKDLLLGLLQRLLPDLGILTVDYLVRDITIPVGKLKDASFDVHCKLADGSRIVIEMQNYVRKSFIDRSLVYTSAAVLEHFVNTKVKGYSIGQTIYIAFTGDPVYPAIPHTPVRLALCDIDSVKTNVLNQNLLQIFVEFPKFAGTLKDITKDTPFLEKLAYVMMEMADCDVIPGNLQDDLLERLFKAADTSKMDDMKKSEYMKSIIGEYDYDVNLEDARDQGWEQGLAEGREKGLAEGRAEGLAEGGAKRAIEVAGNLRRMGLDTADIAKATGLGEAEVEAL